MKTYQIDINEALAPTTEDSLDIEELVKAKLLPLPGNATRLLEMMRNPNVTASQLAEVIGFDPVMASRVLRLANSPMYAFQREIRSITAAVSAIGMRSIYDIVMLAIASDNFSTDLRSMKTGVTVWEHSVATAVASRAIAESLKLRGTEEVFTCGLLHDIGKNLMFQFDQIRYTETESAMDEKAVRDMEKLLFGFDHAQVGFYVCKRWGLADSISHTILNHHNPSRNNEGVVACHIVNVADDLSTCKGLGLEFAEEGKLPNSESTQYLSLTPKILEAVWVETEVIVKDIIEGF